MPRSENVNHIISQRIDTNARRPNLQAIGARPTPSGVLPDN